MTTTHQATDCECVALVTPGRVRKFFVVVDSSDLVLLGSVFSVLPTLVSRIRGRDSGLGSRDRESGLRRCGDSGSGVGTARVPVPLSSLGSVSRNGEFS